MTRGRRWVACVLLAVMGAGFLTLTAVGRWAQQDVLDTAGFTAAVVPVVDDPQVQEALVTEGTTRTLAAIDAAVQEQAGVIAPVLAGLVPSLETPLREAIAATVSSPEFAVGVENATAKVHDELVATLRGQATASISSDEQSITVDLNILKPAIDDALQGSRLAMIVLDNVDLGTVTVPLPVARLRLAVAVADFVGWWTPVAAAIALLLAVAVAPRRSVGLLICGGMVLGAAGVGLLVATLGTGANTSTMTDTGRVLALAIRDHLDDGLWLGLGVVAAIGAVLALTGVLMNVTASRAPGRHVG